MIAYLSIIAKYCRRHGCLSDAFTFVSFVLAFESFVFKWIKN